MMRRRKRVVQRRSPIVWGLVAAIETSGDKVTGRVRVKFPDHQNMLSWWLQVIVKKSQDDKESWPFDIGEEVACVMDDSFENGVVLGACYSSTDAPPAGADVNTWIKYFSDGAVISYNRSTHTLTATLPSGGTASISAPGGITANQVTIDSSGNIVTPGNITANGTIWGKTDVQSGSGQISGKSHKHPDVQSGSSETGTPTNT